MNKKSAQQFADRSDDHEWIKAVPREELLGAIELLNLEAFKPSDQWTHQLATFYLSYCLKNFLLLLDMGIGKTRVVIDLLTELLAVGKIKKAIVVVPGATNITSWADELEKFSGLGHTPLVGTKQQRRKAWRNATEPIYIVTYPGLQSLLCETRKIRKRSRRVIDPELAAELATEVDCTVFDEVHLVRNSDTLSYEICNILSLGAEYRYALTGTPFGRHTEALWAQTYLVDRGATLSDDKQEFLSAFFRKRVTPWNIQYSLVHEAELQRTMRHRSIQYSDTEVSDIPACIIMTQKITLTGDNLRAYARVKAKITQSRVKLQEAISEGKVPKKVIRNYYSKFRQIASGFEYEHISREEVAVDELEEDLAEYGRMVIRYNGNDKLEALLNLLEGAPEADKFIIAHVFEESGDFLHNQLTSAGYPVATLNHLARGDEARIEQLRLFQNSPRVRCCLINVQGSTGGGVGLNLQVANRVVFFEPTDRPDVYQQLYKRAHRTGQEKPVYVTRLCTVGTVEEKVIKYLDEGKSFADTLIRGKSPKKQIGMLL